MRNQWTDQLNIARQEMVAPSFWSLLLGETQKKPIEGWSQVVFRRDQFVEEIPPANVSSSLTVRHKPVVKVRAGDIVVYVYHGLRTYHLTGAIPTKDKYKRLYEMDLSLDVQHVVPLAKAYYQEKDPVGEAINRIKSLFEEYAYSCNHNQLPNLEPPFEIWNTMWLDHLGITIQPTGKVMFRDDPYYSELVRMEQELKNLKEKLALEKEIKRIQEEIKYEQENSHKRHEFAKQEIERDFSRKEAVKDQIHKICSELLQVAANEIRDTLQERVHEGFEKGQLASEIWDELYTVLYAIGDDDRQINLERRIIAHMESLQQRKVSPTTDVKRNAATSTQNAEPSLDPITMY